MQALEKIRLTDKQVEKLEAGELVCIPTSWEEFEEFLVETNYLGWKPYTVSRKKS